jgi:hypothetical protein
MSLNALTTAGTTAGVPIKLAVFQKKELAWINLVSSMNQLMKTHRNSVLLIGTEQFIHHLQFHTGVQFAFIQLSPDCTVHLDRYIGKIRPGSSK